MRKSIFFTIVCIGVRSVYGNPNSSYGNYGDASSSGSHGSSVAEPDTFDDNPMEGSAGSFDQCGGSSYGSFGAGSGGTTCHKCKYGKPFRKKDAECAGCSNGAHYFTCQCQKGFKLDSNECTPKQVGDREQCAYKFKRAGANPGPGVFSGKYPCPANKIVKPFALCNGDNTQCENTCCEAKPCQCSNGFPKKSGCSDSTAQNCRKCLPGYQLNGDECKEKGGVCSSGLTDNQCKCDSNTYSVRKNKYYSQNKQWNETSNSFLPCSSPTLITNCGELPKTRGYGNALNLKVSSTGALSCARCKPNFKIGANGCDACSAGEKGNGINCHTSNWCPFGTADDASSGLPKYACNGCKGGFSHDATAKKCKPSAAVNFALPIVPSSAEFVDFASTDLQTTLNSFAYPVAKALANVFKTSFPGNFAGMTENEVLVTILGQCADGSANNPSSCPRATSSTSRRLTETSDADNAYVAFTAEFLNTEFMQGTTFPTQAALTSAVQENILAVLNETTAFPASSEQSNIAVQNATTGLWTLPENQEIGVLPFFDMVNTAGANAGAFADQLSENAVSLPDTSTPAPTPAPTPKASSSKTGVWVAIAIVAVIIVGFVAYNMHAQKNSRQKYSRALQGNRVAIELVPPRANWQALKKV